MTITTFKINDKIEIENKITIKNVQEIKVEANYSNRRKIIEYRIIHYRIKDKAYDTLEWDKHVIPIDYYIHINE